MRKNKLLIIIMALIATSNASFATPEGKVVSDAANKKQVMEAFADINKNTDTFFTPVYTPEQRKEMAEKKARAKAKENFEKGEKGDGQMRGTLPPIKKLRLELRNRKNKKLVSTETEPPASKNQAVLDCDSMEYFAEKTELHADGHVVMFFPQNNSTIKADRIVYNQTSNLIKAYDNVVLINDGKELLGDYMQVDMNEEISFIDNPTMDVFQIRARAKKGYMYGDKIIQEQGNLFISKKTMIKLRSDMFGPDLDTMYLAEKDRSQYKKDSHGEKFKIRTDDLIINSKDEHDTITLKHAEIYVNDKKVGTIPSITIHTNKAQDYIEGNYPEIGSMSNLGFFAGPGFVFDTPMGSTLKLIPVLNINGGVGFGGLAKFKSATNKTDFGYGSSSQMFIARGKQRLDDNLFLQYGSNAYLDDWFLGQRMAKYMGELVYDDQFLNENFLGEKLDMNFRHRASAGFMQDQDAGDGNIDKLGGDGGIGTARFKYMAEVSQTLYSLNTDRYLQDASSKNIAKDDILSTSFAMVSQGSAAVYGTGDTQMIARIGPRLHTQYKYWMQDLGYFLSGYSDQTPLIMYDRYMYGRSNAYVRESLRVSKYLTLSWLGSMNMSQDSWNGSLMQENSFFFAIGPDDIKLNIGYDTIRQQSFVTMALNLDAKGTNIEYKKMEIKNPNRVGKNKNGTTNPNNSFSSPLIEGESDNPIQRAEVINMDGKI
jgi:hypothetical protein